MASYYVQIYVDKKESYFTSPSTTLVAAQTAATTIRGLARNIWIKFSDYNINSPNSTIKEKYLYTEFIKSVEIIETD